MATKKIQIIEDTGAVDGFQNKIIQKMIFKIREHRFKISIRSDPYDFQSHAILFKWTDSKGFESIISKNPARDYGIKTSYQNNVPATVFDPIIKDLHRIAIDFIS